MQVSKIFLIAAALSATPMLAHADGFAGGSVAWARVNGGSYESGSDTGWKAFVGADTTIMGAEVQYVDFGRLGNNGQRAHAWAPAITAGFPIGAFKPYGKVGVSFLDVQHNGSLDGYHNTRAFWGAGGRFPILPSLGLRIEYERYNLNNSAHEDLVSAGGEFLF